MAEDGLAFLAFVAWGFDCLLLAIGLVVEFEAELLTRDINGGA